MKTVTLAIALLLGGAKLWAAPQESTTVVRTAEGQLLMGVVESYVSAKTITIQNPTGSSLTYIIMPETKLSEDVVVGKRVELLLAPGSTGERPVVARIRHIPMAATGTVTGKVVRVTSERHLILKEEDREVTFALSPGVEVPSELIGRSVTVDTEPRPDGTAIVSRITTTAVTPSGEVQTTERTITREPSGATVTTKQTTVTGTLLSYTPAKTITVDVLDGNKVTYVIDAKSEIPKDLIVGAPIQLVVEPLDADRSVVRVIRFYKPEVPLG